MTALKLASRLRKYTKQNSTSLSDADCLLLLNAVKDDLSDLIAQKDIGSNYFVIPTLLNLTANQREYALPDDVLDHIVSVEIAFTNTLDAFGGIQYLLAYNDDFSQWGVSRIEANIQAHYQNASKGVAYEIQRRSIYVLSGAIDATTLGSSTITSGIRIKYRSYPADLTALTDDTVDLSLDPSTTSLGFPKNFHELWARKAAIDWKAEHPGAVPATTLDANYTNDLEMKLDAMNTPDMSADTLGRIPENTGEDL